MHAAILGVAMSLVGVKVGWEPNPDQSLLYVIQLDAGDMDRFRAEGLIESDVPPQLKNISGIRIELATPLTPPPVQRLPPKAESPPPLPGPGPSVPSAADSSKRQGPRPFGAPEKTASPGGEKTPAWLRTKDARGDEEASEKAGTKGKAAATSGPEPKSSNSKAPTGKPGEPSQNAAAPRPWLPLGVALCTSLGANIYFFWMWMEARGRYRRLLQRQRGREETTDAE